jgi:ribonuclease BN (tRNA processing enzyme)
MPLQLRQTVQVLGCWAHSGAGPTSSFLVTLADTQLLLDVGIDPITRLRAIGSDPTHITDVYLSHAHSDHSSGLANFVFTRQLLARQTRADLPHLRILGSDANLATAASLLGLEYPDRQFSVDYVGLVSGITNRQTGYSVATIDNVHSVPTTGIRVETPLGTLGYTSDSAPYPTQAEFYRHCDILIAEAFGSLDDVGDVSDRGHSNALNFASMIADAKPGVAVPFHFGEQYLKPDAMAQLLAECSAGHSVEIFNPLSI